MTGNVITLADLRTTHLTVACKNCPRAGRLSVARLIEQHGAATGLPVVFASLEATCERAESPDIYRRCFVHSAGLVVCFPRHRP